MTPLTLEIRLSWLTMATLISTSFKARETHRGNEKIGHISFLSQQRSLHNILNRAKMSKNSIFCISPEFLQWKYLIFGAKIQD